MVKKGVVIALVALLVISLVALGYTISSYQSQVAQLNSQVAQLNSQINQANLNISSHASIFDSQLHDLLQEHTFLLIGTVRNGSSAQFNASYTALQYNINQVGALLTPIYGANASQLVNLWNTKANIFINYSNELAAGNPNAQSDYNIASSAYENAVATFWSSNANPYPVFDYNLMYNISSNNMKAVKSAVDDWNARNYPAYFSDLASAYTLMGSYADTIANGIITQNPQDFQ